MSDVCDTCFDTKTIDTWPNGTLVEAPCPACTAVPKLIKIKGLGHGMGSYGWRYATAVSYTSSSITFQGTWHAILANVEGVRRAQVYEAASKGLKGRNATSSWAIAIEKRVRAIWAAQS